MRLPQTSDGGKRASPGGPARRASVVHVKEDLLRRITEWANTQPIPPSIRAATHYLLERGLEVVAQQGPPPVRYASPPGKVMVTMPEYLQRVTNKEEAR